MAVDDLASGSVAAVRRALARPGSVGLIVADADAAALAAALTQARIDYADIGVESDVDPRLDVVPATLAKGLEFDHVVVTEPTAIVAAEPARGTGLRRLYVCLTRAVTSRTVVHAQPLPGELSRPQDVAPR